MAISSEQLILQISDAVRRMPNLSDGLLTGEINAWVARATALVEAAGDMADTTAIKVASQFLAMNRDHNAHQIEVILRHTLERLQLSSAITGPAATTLATGQPFSNLGAIADVLALATTDLFIIDAYADGSILTRFAGFAKEGVPLRILGDARNRQPSLPPATSDWIREYGGRRPLEVRLSAKGALHNREIVVDRVQIWRLGQSLKDVAARSPDTLEPMAGHLVAAELAHYEGVWTASTPLQ